MIPYLIRRAEETAIIQKLKPQNKLLNKEIKKKNEASWVIIWINFYVFPC